MPPRRALRVLAPSALVIAACARPGAPPAAPGVGVLRANGARAEADPTVHGARLLPETVEDDRALGAEPGGGIRGIAAGMRVVSMPSGALLASEERLPQPPAITASLPERLGGGFLFVLPQNAGARVWRADKWLADARPIYEASSAIRHVVLGLDRVYLRTQSGATIAIDPVAGTRLDLGPWPGSSYVGSYAAADGWRAAAITDLRGAVATFDAGATWRPLALPIDVKDVKLFGDAIAVGGKDASQEQVWYEVRADGQVGRLAAPPAPPQAPHEEAAAGAARPLGKRPLAAAIEDGWPLSDGTAVVARDGALARVRLSDGALLEHAPGAYGLKPSRCHPFDLGGGRFGFACGEVRGPTVLYTYDTQRGALVEKKRFEHPRTLLAYANGALAVRGPCDPLAEDPGDDREPPSTTKEAKKPSHVYCVMRPSGEWSDLNVAGAIGGERLVVLGDGRVAILSPPSQDLSTGRLTLLSGKKQSTTTLHFQGKAADPDAPIPADVARVLRLGVWLDGFEERRPGVLGGWIDTGGSVLGIEIALDGKVTYGAFVRDSGAPIVSGRYGLGWTASRRGIETTDGGMTWTPIDVPDPLVPLRAVTSRACGPIGCTAAGWMRVGWGAPKRPPAPDFPPLGTSARARSTPVLDLACEPAVAAPPPVPDTRRANAPRAPEPVIRPTTRPGMWGGAVLGVLGSTNGMDFPPFYTVIAPPIRAEERGITQETSERIERAGSRSGPLARVYAWGPKTGEWEHVSRWIVRWVSPYAGWSDVKSSAPAAPPQLVLDAARFSSSSAAMPVMATWQLGTADDASHALLAARKALTQGGQIALFELEDGRAPIEIRRSDGESFSEIDAVVRSGSRWYVATPPSASGEWMSVVWQLDGPVARELARVPRAAMDARPIGARLARRSDGRAIGFVVDGQPSPDRPGALRWVLPIDVESGALGDPEPLGAADLGDRDALPLCAEDDTGWVLDTPLSVGTRVAVGGRHLASLSSIDARVRITPARACVERLVGTMPSLLSSEQVALLSRTGKSVPPAGVPVIAVTSAVRATQLRYLLRCTRRSP